MPGRIVKSQDVTVIALEEDCLDSTTVQGIKRSLCPLVQPNARVVLDLARVCHVDGAGVGAVLSFHRQMSAVGGKNRSNPFGYESARHDARVIELVYQAR